MISVGGVSGWFLESWKKLMMVLVHINVLKWTEARYVWGFLIIQMMVHWLTLFFLLNLVQQNHQLETKSDYQRGLSKSIPETHIKATIQYGFQITKWVNTAACSAWLKIAHPGAKSKQHYLKMCHSCWLLSVQSLMCVHCDRVVQRVSLVP